MKFRKSTFVATGLAIALLASGCATTASNTTSPAGNQPSASQAGNADQGIQEVTYKDEGPVKAKDGKKLKVGVSVSSAGDQWQLNLQDALKKRAAEDNVELTIVAADDDAAKQLNQVQNFLNQGVDGVIVVPTDADAVKPITTLMMSKKVPLVYVNRKPSYLPKGIVYVGSASKEAGLLEMEALAKLVNNKGNVAILEGPPGQEAPRERTKGCEEIAAKHGMKVVAKATAMWDRAKGLQVAENWIQSGLKIDVICSNNDDMALGAITAYKNAGKLKDVKIGGVDGTAGGLKAMKAGELAVSVFQDAKHQGFGAMDSIVKLHDGQELPQFINVPFQLITPENVDKYIGKNTN